MSLSRLLLVAAHSRKGISGERNDEVRVEPQTSPDGRKHYAGEVILCFQLDDPADKQKLVAHSLGIRDKDKRCDGIVFYTQDNKTERVICLVEMKSTNIEDAGAQLIATKEHLEQLLIKECEALPDEASRDECRRQVKRIVWKACLYHRSGMLDKAGAIPKLLKERGFKETDILTKEHNNLRPLLEGRAKRHKDGRR